MMVLLIVLLSAATSAGCTYFIARRWPRSSAPRLTPDLIAHELLVHPRLRTMLRARIDPEKATGLALTAASAVVVGATISVGVLAAIARRSILIARWDNALARFGASHATPESTQLLRAITWLGGAQAVGTTCAVTAVMVWRRRDRILPSALFLASVVLGQFCLSNLIKVVVARSRPDIEPLTGFSGSSFPSGHTTAAAATYLAAALLLGRGRSMRYKAACAAAAAATAVSVGATRVFLGVHWFTDVLAGYALGVGWFALASIAFGGRTLSFGAPAREAEALEASTDQ